MSQVVSANSLARGTVLFYRAGNGWVEDIAEATVYADKVSAEAGLADAKRDEDRAIVVDCFLVDQDEGDEGSAAMTLRNAIRAFGPTIDYLPAAPESDA